MNKKLVLIITIVLVLIVAVTVWKSAYSSSVPVQRHATNQSSTSANTSTTVHDESMTYQTRDKVIQDNLSAQLQSFQKKPGNITQFLNQLRERCEQKDCNAALRLALENYPDQQFAQTVKNLLDRLPQYEKDMQSTILSTAVSPKERFDTLWQLREKMLGTQEAMLGFAEEKKYADYRFEYQNLMQRVDMSTEQRLKTFEDLQLKYMDVIGAEGNIAAYEQALSILKNAQADSQQTEQMKKMLQERYLNDQEKKEIQQRDQRQSLQTQQAEQYQNAVKQLQNEMQPLKDRLDQAEWEKQYEMRLEQLRKNMFS